MLHTSKAFDDAIKAPQREIYFRLKINDAWYEKDKLHSAEVSYGSSNEEFAIGTAYANSLKVVFSEVITDFSEMDEVYAEVGVKLPDGTIEYIPLGYFVISEQIDVNRNDNNTTIQCLDNMVLMEGEYVSELSYPARIIDVAVEIANKSGMEVNQVSFARLSTRTISRIEGSTYRQAIAMIAQFEGGFAIFDREGKLDIRTLNNTNFEIRPAEYRSKGMTKNDLQYRLGGISVDVDDETTLQAGSTSGSQINLENSVMNQDLLNGIYSNLENLNFYPFALEWWGNPALEYGDWVTLFDLEGNAFKAPVLKYSLSFGGGLSSSISANVEVTSPGMVAYRSPLEQEIIAIMARISANGKNRVYDDITEPDNPKENDIWFRPNGPDTDILIYKHNEIGELEWTEEVSTKTTRLLREAIAKQQQKIEEAKQTADEAADSINTAVVNAGFTSLDETISSVQSRANTAFDTANDLIGEVSGYSQTVDGFNQTINNYTNQVANFRSDVDGFSGTVASYSADVRSYATQVSTLTNTVGGFNSTVANIDGRVTSLNTAVNGISSTVSGLGGRISTVEQTARGLQNTVASKADQTQVTQLSNAYNIFVGGIESKKNLLSSMERGAISSFSGDEYSISGYVRSPYIPVEPSSYYIASLDGNPVSHTIYSYSDIGQFISASSQNTSYKYVGANVKYVRVVMYNSNPDLKYQLEKGFMVTDYVPFIGDVSSAQISMLQNNINLRVTSTELNNAVGGKADKNQLITQINLSPDTALIQSSNILLDGNVTIRGTAWMDGAVLKNLSVDGAKLQDATIGSAKIANLDVSKISGNTTEFVRSAWNAGLDNVTIDASGMYMTGSGTWRRSYLTATGFDLYNGSGGNNKAGAIGYFKEHIDSTGSSENFISSTKGSKHYLGIAVNPSHNIVLGYQEYTALSNRYYPSISIDGYDGRIRIHQSISSSTSEYVMGVRAFDGEHGMYGVGFSSSGGGIILGTNGTWIWQHSTGKWVRF